MERMGCGRGRLDRRGNLFQSGVKTDGDRKRRSKLGRCLWGRREGVGRRWWDHVVWAKAVSTTIRPCFKYFQPNIANFNQIFKYLTTVQ